MDLLWYAVIGVFLFTMYDEFTGHGGQRDKDDL